MTTQNNNVRRKKEKKEKEMKTPAFCNHTEHGPHRTHQKTTKTSNLNLSRKRTLEVYKDMESGKHMGQKPTSTAVP